MYTSNFRPNLTSYEWDSRGIRRKARFPDSLPTVTSVVHLEPSTFGCGNPAFIFWVSGKWPTGHEGWTRGQDAQHEGNLGPGTGF